MSRFRSRRTQINTEFFSNYEYTRAYWSDWDYQILRNHIQTRKKRGRSDSMSWNDIIIMADTETSKSPEAVTDQIISPDYDLMAQELITPVDVSVSDLKNIPDYKHYIRSCPLTIKKGAIPLTFIWEEWSARYPWIFPADITHPADMVQHITDYYNAIKPQPYVALENHVCLWTVSLRAYHHNIVTLYGYKPTDMITCITRIHDTLPGQRTVLYFHNLSYDYCFLRQYMFKEWGTPAKELATKPHYPIWLKFENEINIKDSLILFQRSLEKAGKDFGVEHAKAVGKWDYDIIRNQDYNYSDDELTYAEYDTLCGVECLDVFMANLGKDITSIPYTSTGIIRNDTRVIGKAHNAHEQFTRICIDDVELLLKAQRIFSGGYTHANRYIIGNIIKGNIIPLDFASKYPYIICAGKMPMERYTHLKGSYTKEQILKWYQKDYSVLMTVKLTNVHLKNAKMPMPYIQQAGERVSEIVNGIFDNGRVLDCQSITMEITEIDLFMIDRYYTADEWYITDVYIAVKDYLPRWFTDYVFNLYVEKCKLKGGDKVLYDISKTRVNGCFGLCSQHPVPDEIKEDYNTGEYYQDKRTMTDLKNEYEKYINRKNSILPYQWGIYICALARLDLFMLGECAGRWLYSDTDSVYGMDWNMEKVEAFNNQSLQRLHDNNYDIVTVNGKRYQLGKAEIDYAAGYSEFITTGAKRYATRAADTGELKLTVAGVPKKTGVKCLHNDLRNFKKGLVFDGRITGKKLHTFIMEDMHVDKWGNEVADSIDLSPNDYTLGSTDEWEWIFDGLTGQYEIECLDEGVIT